MSKKTENPEEVKTRNFLSEIIENVPELNDLKEKICDGVKNLDQGNMKDIMEKAEDILKIICKCHY